MSALNEAGFVYPLTFGHKVGINMGNIQHGRPHGVVMACVADKTRRHTNPHTTNYKQDACNTIVTYPKSFITTCRRKYGPSERHLVAGPSPRQQANVGRSLAWASLHPRFGGFQMRCPAGVWVIPSAAIRAARGNQDLDCAPHVSDVKGHNVRNMARASGHMY